MKDQSRFAKKSLGQNFLTSTQVREGILKQAGDLRGKRVLEIGPGLGFLTEKLLEAGALVTAVELDERAITILNKKFAQEKNFTLIHGDILQQDLDALFPPPLRGDDLSAERGSGKGAPPLSSPSQGENGRYCVIANIPYNITNPILRKLLEQTRNQPQFCLLMVQKEVAQKICDPQSDIHRRHANPPLPLGEEQGEGYIGGAGEGPVESGDLIKNNSLCSPTAGGSRRGVPVEKSEANKILSVPLQGQIQRQKAEGKRQKGGRSILSIAVEVYAQAGYCFTVGREHFEPSPKVDSAIMRLDIRDEPLVDPELQRDFFTVVNAGFSEKRKKLGNVLGKFFGVSSGALLGEIDGNRRAETLTIEEWITITHNFQAQK